MRQRPESVSSKSPRRRAAFRPSGAFNSPASPLKSPEVKALKLNFQRTEDSFKSEDDFELRPKWSNFFSCRPPQEWPAGLKGFWSLLKERE